MSYKNFSLEKESKNSPGEIPFVLCALTGSLITDRANSYISDDTDATKHYQKRSILKTSGSWVNGQKCNDSVERKDKFGNGIHSGSKKHKVSFNRSDLKPEKSKKPIHYYYQNKLTTPICCSDYNLCKIF